MSNLRVEKAIYAYRQFIREHSAFRAYNVEFGQPDPPFEPFVEVPRDCALGAFLKKNPEYADFHSELLDVRDQPKFFFKEVLWNSTSSA